jgi:hypothetical protein
VQFESKQRRVFWMNAALGLVPDTVISLLLSYALSGGVVGFFAVLVGIQMLYFVIWLKKSIWTWTIFKLNGRKHLISNLIDYLRTNKFPEPEDYEKSAEGYFSSVLSNEDQSIDVRLKASASLAELNFLTKSGQVQHFIRLTMAYEEALESYKKSFPRAI